MRSREPSDAPFAAPFDAERADRDAAAAAESPLERMRRRLAEDPEACSAAAGSGEAARRVARDLGLPVARLRETIAFFPQLLEAPPLRVCIGTSCFLSGADAVADACPDAERVHCLGHCDRSPCIGSADGAVYGGVSPEAAAAFGAPGHAGARPATAARPEIRCAAPEAIITRNLGRGDSASLASATRTGVYAALAQALRGAPEDVLATVERSEERGRGGGGFPTGAKWRAAATAPGPSRVVVANGDEGDPGSFVDRVLMEEDPHSVLEGLALCAFAVGASEGVVFVRSEYPRALARMRAAAEEACGAGLLGPDALGPGRSFHVRVAPGFGSYVGGEETALLETLEGRAGEVRLRPPYPARRGLHGRPTVVNNVETLVAIPWIVARGADAYRRLGTPASSGTKALCLNAGFPRPGLVEVELGHSLRDVLEAHGGATAGALEAVLLGGPMGSLLFEDAWDVSLCYQALAQRGIRLGHGGLVAIPRGVDWHALLRHHLAFMVRESCGRCVPCREGSRRARDAVARGEVSAAGLDATLAQIERASLCGFGRGAPGPLRELLARCGDAALGRRS